MKTNRLAFLALAAGLSAAALGADAPSYTLIVEPFDWGPAVSKIVVDLGQNVKVEALKATDFQVAVERRNRPDGSVAQTVTDWATGKTRDSVGTLPVVKAGFSDASGTPVAATSGRWVTLEVEVGPTAEFSAPFLYDGKAGLNHWVDLAMTVTSGRLGLTLTPATQKPLSIPSLKGVDLTGVQEYTDADYGKIVLHYASYAPVADAKKHPLVIWLHGAGEGGTDPSIALLGNRVTRLFEDTIQKTLGGAFVLAPQTPLVWMNNGVEFYPKDGSTQYTRALKAVIDDYVDRNPTIDRSRIYLGGCSNGGFMTMKLLLTYPNYFAAAYPACEAYADAWISDAQIASIARIPLWFTQAKSDFVVNAAKGGYVVDTYRRLVKAGAPNVHLSYFDKVEDLSGRWFQTDGKTPYEYMGHWSWIHTLNNDCTLDFDGKPVTVAGRVVSLWAWLALQHQ